MGEPSIGQQLVDAVLADFPDHKPGTRAVHSNGIGVVGHFKASDVARDYCRAEHFQGDVIPATIRFSNGSGSPVVHDGWPDARGMAVRFHLPSGAATDLVAMTLREFVSPTVDEFLAFSRAGRPQPVAPQSGWRKMLDMEQTVQFAMMCILQRRPAREALRISNDRSRTQFVPRTLALDLGQASAPAA